MDDKKMFEVSDSALEAVSGGLIGSSTAGIDESSISISKSETSTGSSSTAGALLQELSSSPNPSPAMLENKILELMNKILKENSQPSKEVSL